MDKVIVILGPTAVGKTKLSIQLAKRYNGEIINADSMQVYKGLDIGTAKVTDEEKEGIKHHLFDIKEVWEEYNIYEYQRDCRYWIDNIKKRGKVPIIVGGTGLYIKASLYDYKLSLMKDNNDYNDMTNEEIYQRLLEVFPNVIIDKNNRRRLVRALSYYNETGKLITENITDKIMYDCIFIGLTCDREKLYGRINDRVDMMIEDGLLKEVLSFYDRGIRTKPLLGGIGYREIYNYFDGNCLLEEAIENIKKHSRNYAKRQYTFFNNKLNVNWFEVDFNNFENTIVMVDDFIRKNSN